MSRKTKDKYTHCTNCGAPIVKIKVSVKDICLPDYEPKDDLCWMRNATRSVVERFRADGTVSPEDLKRLPTLLVFDPSGDSPEEEAIGKELGMVISRYKEELIHA